jgi:CheY-like chemotaxis protein
MTNSLNRIRVLVVDDDPITLLAVGLALRQAGFDVGKATDGVEALGVMKAAAAQECPFQAVVTDFEMPGMNGRELIQSLAGPSVGRPFIALMSSLPRAELERGSAPIPCDFFFQKPVSYSDLSNAINAHFAHA